MFEMVDMSQIVGVRLCSDVWIDLGNDLYCSIRFKHSYMLRAEEEAD